MYAVSTSSPSALTKPTTRPSPLSSASPTALLPRSSARCRSGDGRFGQPTKNPSRCRGSTPSSRSVYWIKNPLRSTLNHPQGGLTPILGKACSAAIRAFDGVDKPSSNPQGGLTPFVSTL